VAGIGLLDSVHRQRADRIDAQLIEGGIVLHGTLLVRPLETLPARAAATSPASGVQGKQRMKSSASLMDDAPMRANLHAA
jgi:hypothetical protein